MYLKMSSLIKYCNKIPHQGLLHRFKICRINNNTTRYYSSSSKGNIKNWLLRKVYGTIFIVAITGTGLVVTKYWIDSHVDSKLKWIKSYYPTDVSSKIAARLENVSDWLKKSNTNSNSTTVQAGDKTIEENKKDNSKVDDGQFTKLQHAMKLLEIKLANVEKENYELRKELSKHTGVSPNAVQPGQKTLIELYSDILNLLTDFDAKSPLTDRKLVHTLPQVVVVGDQSAGKTSVLEMVASARIFPRGAGEMMTRSPVMVTLSEGPEHIAMFNDSTTVYDLKKESQLKELRGEIEKKMKNSVSTGSTISSTPISLTVKGPQLKRMVLIDLPGIINTVTSGMAVNTREDILRMCRQYMQNPNAIVMCVQDGSVDAERSIVTELASQVDPSGHRTIFVLTKADMAESNGLKQERITSILDGQLFPMKALGYYAVITGRGNTSDSVEQIQRYERDYFAKSKLFQNGMLRENQLGTRNMIGAVTDEFWKMVEESINDQSLLFKTLRYNLEAEWRNRFPGERTLDRNDLFELGKADILTQVAGLQVLPPPQWEDILMDSLWSQIGPKVLDETFVRAAQSRSSDEFNTIVDIELHKWAESLQLATLCADVGMTTMFEQLHNKLGSLKGGKFHTLGQGLREEVESLSRSGHKWESYNVDQLKYVQMSALDDKDVRTADQWQAAVNFMKNTLKKQIKQANDNLNSLIGPKSFSDRWLGWSSQTKQQAERQAIMEELDKFLKAEPNHPNKLFPDEILTVQRSLKNQGLSVLEDEINFTWNNVYKLHFLKQTEQKAQKCQKGFILRNHSPEYACPEVTFFWRVQQVMKSSAHTLRVQILDREIRQLEQQVKIILDTISSNEDRKKELIRGDAIDKAEQLKQVRLIQEKLDSFKDALIKQQKRQT